MPLHQKLKPPDERHNCAAVTIDDDDDDDRKTIQIYWFRDKNNSVCTTKTRKKSKYTTVYWAICKFRIDLAHFLFSIK